MAGQTAITATPTQADSAQADSAPPAPDLAALKTRQQAAWSSGNYAIVGSTLQIDLHTGQRRSAVITKQAFQGTLCGCGRGQKNHA